MVLNPVSMMTISRMSSNNRGEIKWALKWLGILVGLELLLLLGGIALSLFTSYATSSLLPETVSPDSAVAIFNAIISIDGVLIGFTAFTLAGFLTNVNNVASELSFGLVRQGYIYTLGSTKPVTQVRSAENEMKFNYLKKLTARRRYTIVLMLAIFLALLLSVFFSLSSIAIASPTRTDIGFTRLPFYFPFGFLLSGVIFLAAALLLIGPAPLPKLPEP